MTETGSSRIFVSIASYRDADCINTLESLFSKANHPERIFVGLCWQAILGVDNDRYPVANRISQCRVIQVDAFESKGVCWARSKVQSLWDGEEYILQIDSHMRFVEGWDDLLLTMLTSCPSDKPVLSSYPPAFTPPDTIISPLITTMHATNFDNDGILGLDSIGSEPHLAPEIPQQNPFCAAGFLFADSRIILDIPYDPYLYFHGEEITLAVRLWTYGWDIFSPNAVILYHDYDNHPGRERHWKDHDSWLNLDTLAKKRVRHLLKIELSTDPEVLIDIDKYNLGQIRSLEDYEVFSGVNFSKQTIEGKTTEEIIESTPKEVQRKNHKQVFTRIWQNNEWGSGSQRSGSGSTYEATSILRPKLIELIDFLKIESLVDVGCGGCEWIGEITTPLQFYIGLEIVDDILDEIKNKFHDHPGCFFSSRDVILDKLPRSNAILIRDVMTHYPNYAVKAALNNIRESGANYMMMTHHPSGYNEQITLGAWRPLNLCAEPFFLPPPRIFVSEDNQPDGKGLGIWHISSLF